MKNLNKSRRTDKQPHNGNRWNGIRKARSYFYTNNTHETGYMVLFSTVNVALLEFRYSKKIPTCRTLWLVTLRLQVPVPSSLIIATTLVLRVFLLVFLHFWKYPATPKQKKKHAEYVFVREISRTRKISQRWTLSLNRSKVWNLNRNDVHSMSHTDIERKSYSKQLYCKYRVYLWMEKNHKYGIYVPRIPSGASSHTYDQFLQSYRKMSSCKRIYHFDVVIWTEPKRNEILSAYCFVRLNNLRQFF